MNGYVHCGGEPEFYVALTVHSQIVAQHERLECALCILQAPQFCGMPVDLNNGKNLRAKLTDQTVPDCYFYNTALLDCTLVVVSLVMHLSMGQ